MTWSLLERRCGSAVGKRKECVHNEGKQPVLAVQSMPKVGVRCQALRGATNVTADLTLDVATAAGRKF